MGSSNPDASGITRRDFIKATAAVAGLSTFASGTAAAAAGASSNRVLLKGGYVITLDRSVGDFSQADVLIEGSKLAAIAPKDAVFIGGKAMKRGGKLLDVDLDRVRKLAMVSRDYLVSASGFKPKEPRSR